MVCFTQFGFFKYGPIPASFLFSFFSNSNNTNWKQRRWFAWVSNPGLQNGRSRRNHGAMAAPHSVCEGLGHLIFFLIRSDTLIASLSSEATTSLDKSPKFTASMMSAWGSMAASLSGDTAQRYLTISVSQPLSTER